MTTNSLGHRSTFRYGSFVLGVLLSVISLIGGCRPPQVLDDEECFKSVDALWTAVTARSPDLLQTAVDQLDRLHESGQLSDEGHQALLEIAGMAEQGDWEPAARKLKTFIQGQRRQTP